LLRSFPADFASIFFRPFIAVRRSVPFETIDPKWCACESAKPGRIGDQPAVNLDPRNATSVSPVLIDSSYRTSSARQRQYQDGAHSAMSFEGLILTLRS
jgi:hypothetical protein